jgi:hypothetical protein
LIDRVQERFQFKVAFFQDHACLYGSTGDFLTPGHQNEINGVSQEKDHPYIRDGYCYPKGRQQTFHKGQKRDITYGFATFNLNKRVVGY